MRGMAIFLAVSMGMGLALPLGWAKPPETAEEAQALLASLNYQSGSITLPGGIAALTLSDNFRYLNPADTERLLTDGWGNPPGQATLGMLLDTGANPLSGQGWGVVLSYQEDGHVNDSDAEEIDYSALLGQMKEASAEANEARVQQGYARLDLLGWAEAPVYDKASHKFYWAKELKAENAPENTLNYDVRVLGRKGVLVLRAVGGMSQLALIKSKMQQVMGLVDFTPGNTYADFDSATDQVAAYGLAALVAGGAAAKLGLFAKLLAMAVAFKKVVIAAVAGIVLLLKNLFKRKQALPVASADAERQDGREL